MAIFLTLILIIYCLLITGFIIGFGSVKKSDFSKEIPLDGVTTFTLVIPFRDEEKHLPALLYSLENIDYPKDAFEVILVNDGSTDASLEIIKEWMVQFPEISVSCVANKRQSHAPKKDAILTALALSTHGWIMTTDADCTFNPNRLRVFNRQILQTKSLCVAGPVTTFVNTNQWLHGFEALDFASLQGATRGSFGIGKPFMANGANLAYHKNTFVVLGGFKGNDHIASGDDLFILEKFIKEHKKATTYLSHPLAIVQTFPVESWERLFEQRKRWAAKSTSYTQPFAKAVGLIVFFGNLAFILGFVWVMVMLALKGNTVVGASENESAHAFAKAYVQVGILILSKIVVDGILIWRSLKSSNQSKIFIWYLPSIFFYPVWSTVVAVAAFTTSYTWKGRSFKR